MAKLSTYVRVVGGGAAVSSTGLCLLSRDMTDEPFRGPSDHPGRGGSYTVRCGAGSESFPGQDRMQSQALCRDWVSCVRELVGESERILLDHRALGVHQEAAVGLYAAASKVVSFGTPLVTSFTSAMFTYMSRLTESRVGRFDVSGKHRLIHTRCRAACGCDRREFAGRVISTLYAMDTPTLFPCCESSSGFVFVS